MELTPKSDPTPPANCPCGVCLSPVEAAAAAGEALGRSPKAPGTLRLASAIGSMPSGDSLSHKVNTSPTYYPIRRIRSAIVDIGSRNYGVVVNADLVAATLYAARLLQSLADMAVAACNSAKLADAQQAKHGGAFGRMAANHRACAVCCMAAAGEIDEFAAWCERAALKSGGRFLPTATTPMIGDAAIAWARGESSEDFARSVIERAIEVSDIEQPPPKFSETDDSDQT